MEDFNNFTSLTSVKRSPVANPSFNDAGGNNENELNPEMASKLKNQLPSKNFMSPTISAANKTSFLKKKILAERNQTLDVVDSKAVKFPVVEAAVDDGVEKDFVGESYLQPYDPIKNYLSPRPKFLRYNPNRRREIFVLQDNGDGVRSGSSSSDSGITSVRLELREDSSGSTDSCSQKESVEEVMDMVDKEGEVEDDTGSCSQKESVEKATDLAEQKGEGEDDDDEDEIEEEMGEFGEDKGCGFLKFLLVVIALISTTQAICSMNSPSPSSETREVVGRFNNWYSERWSNVHGVVGLNFSEVGDSIRESCLVVGRLKEGVDAVETTEELEAQLGVLDNEVEYDEIDVIQDEILSQKEDIDQLQLIEILQEDEIDESEGIEIHNVEADQGLNQDLHQNSNHDGVITEEEQSDASENKSELTIDDTESAKDMEEMAGFDLIDELKTTDALIGMAGFDPIVAVLIGLSILILTSFGVIYHSRWMKMKPSSPVATMVANENLVAGKEEIKNLEPSPSSTQLMAEGPLANSASLVVHQTPKDVSKETSHVHAPTVELLGEFVFGGEVTSSSFRSNDMKSYTMSMDTRPTTVSSGQTRSSRMETAMGDSLQNTAEKMVKKPRRKNAEVTPSPVRRSNRIQNRSAIKSP